MDFSHPRLIDLYTQLGHTLHHRLLLSDDPHDIDTNGHDVDTNGHISSSGCEIEEGHVGGDHDIEEAFQHIYFVMLFMACLWFIGKVFARCGLPSLVGEIVCGIILGPNLLGFVPYSDALIVIGEIGLVLLVLEAGIDVSIGHLKVVGFRGCAVAVFGSMLPLGIGTGLAMAYGQSPQSAFAIGACLAPTSMGIALNVLRNAKVLNTPTGQLIIAAAVLDDVIALMLLSELEAMADPTPLKILLPLIVSPAFILFFGFLAIKVTPWLIQKIMIKTSKHQHENVILLLVFISTFGLVPICYYAGSSHLLGAFLAGLMFCTDHTIHEAWSNQIKRIMQWMLRIFFACTIGFAVPIQDFWSKPVIQGGLIYLVAIVGKLLTGIFAKPLTVSEFLTIAFSMSAWGEFAFILATASYGTGAIDKESYSSVLMAVLLSVIIAPLLLRTTLSIVRKQKQKRLTGARDAHYKEDLLNMHPVYFCVHTKGKGRWGHQDKLLHCIFNLQLTIIDFRAFNEAEYNYSHHLPIVQDVFYVQDQTLLLPPTKRLGKVDERKLQQRYKEIKRSLKETMGDPHASIDVMRWLPGVRRTDDIQSPVKNKKKTGETEAQKQKRKQRERQKKTASYCRKEAYKQARLALDSVEQARSSSYLVSGISRIRPAHDALHRDRFTYHGGIHTEQDELMAMAFIDTLQSLQVSLSPENRASPTNSTKHEPLSHDELFAKINTLRNCVEHLQVFQPALSDDGRDRKDLISNPPSIHSMNGDNTNTFAEHYAKTFQPLQHPNVSADEGIVRHVHEPHEHGSIYGIEHNKPATYHATMNTVKGKKGVPPQPGLFVSHSLPPRNVSHHGHHVHTHGHGHHTHAHFNHLPRDVYPHDSYAGYHHPLTHSHSSGVDHHVIHPHPHSSSEDIDGSHDSDDDLHPCDTMYGDEDAHHRPLAYTNLGDLYEDPMENLAENEPKSPVKKMSKKTKSLQLNILDKEEEKKQIKHSTTWNKIFKHKKISDDDESDNGKKKEKKKRRLKRKKNKEKNGHTEVSQLSDSSTRKLSFEEDEECDSTPVDLKMLEIPAVLIAKTHNKEFDNERNKISDDEDDLNNNIDANETQPLKLNTD